MSIRTDIAAIVGGDDTRFITADRIIARIEEEYPTGVVKAALGLVQALAEEQGPAAHNEALDESVRSLDIPLKVANALMWAEIRTVGDLVKLYPREVMHNPNIGRVAIGRIEQALFRVGLTLAPTKRP